MQTLDDLRRQVAQFEKDAEVLDREALSWHRAWALSLGVANGAGCLAAGSALVNSKLDLWLTLLPSLWAFAAGLLVAGFLPFAHYKSNRSQLKMVASMKLAAERVLSGQQTGDIRPEVKIAGRVFLRWSRTSSLCTAVSSAAFSVGLLWPLVRWTLRL